MHVCLRFFHSISGKNWPTPKSTDRVVKSKRLSRRCGFSGYREDLGAARIALVFCYTEIDMAENFGPERYAPPHRRPPKDRDDVANVVELLGKQRSDAMAESASAENVNVMIRRMAIDSMEDIDRVIRELESVRDMLRNEGARVSREVSSYASLNHATATAMKVIAESLNQWKERPLQNKEAASDPR
jgi:hypothetical protein